MQCEFDRAKSREVKRKHGVSLQEAEEIFDQVYIVDQKNKVVRRPVQTGPVTPAGIAVAQGLEGNERVVLRAGGFLNPGETVRPQRQAS